MRFCNLSGGISFDPIEEYHIPRPTAYSASILCAILAPEVILTPMPTSQMLQLGGQSVNRLTTLNSFSNISYNPIMQSEISAFISLLCPGYVNFSFEFDDLGESDPYLTCLAATFAKMLFSYSDQRRWNSLTENSITVAETAILRAALQASIANTQLRGAQGRPLDNMVPVRNANRPPIVPYVECQDRPLYLCDIDDPKNVPDQAVEEVHGAWQLRQALYECAHKTSIAGAEGVFNALSRRVLDFFIEMNDYNRRNWYTSLRLTHEHMDRIYDDATEAPCVVPIKGKTVLYIFRSLAKNTIRSRRADYMSQDKLECAIARDLVESGAKRRMFERAVARYEIPRNMFTSNDILLKNEPSDGPLKEIFTHIRASGFGALVRDYYIPVVGTPMSEIHEQAIEIILANAIDFGISEEVFMYPSLMRGRGDHMARLAAAELPHTNVFDEDGMPRANARQVNPVGLQNLITSYTAMERLFEMSFDRPLLIELPAPISVTQSDFKTPSPSVLSVNYSEIESANSLRQTLVISQRVIKLIMIDRQKLQRPDLYLKDLPTCETYFPTHREYNHLVSVLSEWVNDMHRQDYATINTRN